MDALSALLREDRRVTWLVGLFVALQLILALWDLPSSFGWENDGIAPRDLFGGLAFNLSPGKAHRYPLLHYVLLAVVSLPFLLLAVARADGLSMEALEPEILSVDVMTGISVSAKLLAVSACAITLLTLARMARTLVDRDAGLWATLFAATCLSFGYYGRTSNLDGPALMWITLALERMVAALGGGDSRDYRRFALFAAAAIATKDQAYAAFVLTGPLFFLAYPCTGAFDAARRQQHFARLPGFVAALALGYAIASGALFNPTGFAQHVALIAGDNSQDWKVYTGSGAVLRNARDLWLSQGQIFWPWPVVALCWLGVPIAARRGALALVPLCAGLSSLVAFTLVVGRVGHRFSLPMGLYLAFYGGAAISWLLSHARPGRRLRRVALAVPIMAGCYAAWPVAQLALTQLGDARYRVEAFLRSLPQGARVETYGLLVYLPRLDRACAHCQVTHVGHRPDVKIRGVAHVDDDYGNLHSRNPDCLVIPQGYADRYLLAPDDATSTQSQASLADRDAVGFFTAATGNRLPGYDLRIDTAADLPHWAEWLGARPVRIHGSTGKRQWVLCRNGFGPR